ncbi:MAG: sensor histidine kinase [Lewinellaceae bacterium]|nr:sensor histidine kinase [Saprospiraceae bacterium]MCB9311391.1 sensor histidine kinase [Lewinellaceae bacterium]
MNKNLSSFQIALVGAGLAGLGTLLPMVVMVSTGAETPVWAWFFLPVLVSYGVFVVTRRLIDFFIYRRIKVLYKYIHEVKSDPDSKKDQIVTNETLENAEKNVIAWAEQKEKEVNTLRSLETYRRQFLGNISHELKTPIFNIQGYLHTLLEGGLTDNSINIKFLDRAAKNVERLETIVSDLETIAQLESEQMVLEVEPFEIKALVREVFEDHEQLAFNRRIRMMFKSGAENEFMILADRDRIRQVLNNLITNSLKYGKEGGTTKVSFYDMDDRILVEVGDDGIGIDEKHLKHVFDRFYRVDVSRSRELGGSGLGLSIVKHILEAHKQSITVRSTVGLGTTFSFTMQKVK